MSAVTTPLTPPTPTTKKRRTWPYIAVIVGALLIGIGIGRASAPTPAAPVAAPATTRTVPYAPSDNPAAPNPYLPNNSATATPTGPLTTFSDGIYEVGTGDGQIAPGKYRSTNENGAGSVFVKKSGDSYGDYATGKGQLIVTVTTSDVEVEVRDATFTKM